MKFTNGFWLLREGVSLSKAVQVQRVDHSNDSIDVLYATRKVEHRGQTLNIGTVNVAIDAAADDVIRVKVSHHKGGRAPLKFEVTESAAKTLVTETNSEISFTAGDLTARVSKSDFKIDWLGHGKVFATQGDKGLFYTDSPEAAKDGGTKHISAQMPIGVSEQIFGLGERFTSFVKNGQSVDIFNEDPGTSSEQAYKNVPFYLSNKGYGVFVNHTGRVSFEVGSETVNKVQFSVAGQELEYLVIYGPTPKEILRKYTALTGRAPLLPKWSFGLWLSTSFVTDYDEKTVTSFIEGMRERDIPLSVFHFDCFWMREYQWCDFQWDPRVFPDPQGMLSRLKKDGLRISLWINPYIGQASPLFAEAAELGYLLKRTDGTVWQWDLWQAGNAIVDFTNPGAREWFQSKLRPLLEMGVDCFKTDFGERIPTDAVYFDGSDAEQMHNLYTQLYNETVWQILREYRKDDAILFARSATAGGQKMPVHWGGDNTSTFESMAESLRGGLSLGLSGFGYWSHDIGGFEGNPDPAVFKRWVPFGLLSSHSRLHGNESVRVPWAFDDEAVDVTRKFTKLKASLMPYLYETAHQVTNEGTPMMRAMILEFPDDRTCQSLDAQYMLGPSLLVAPVFTADGTVQFYLPAGNWTNFFTKEIVAGGRWVTEQHGFDSIPLYVREGATIKTGRDDTFDYEF
jgi:alpha-D-xyloside xylohydrolase